MRLLLAILLIHTLVHATTITGDIYDGDSMKQLDKTLITIEDNNGNIVVQKIFNQRYELEIPEGNYTLRAYHYVNGTLEQYTDHKFQTCEENMEFDLILIPYELQALVPGFEAPPTPDPEKNTGDVGIDKELIGIILSIAFFGIGILVMYLYVFKMKKEPVHKQETSSTKHKKQDELLDEDCKKVLKILKENEGRMIQKEIRDILNFSETKMSLIISELEIAGYIKKIKKGRENILKLV